MQTEDDDSYEKNILVQPDRSIPDNLDNDEDIDENYRLACEAEEEENKRLLFSRKTETNFNYEIKVEKKTKKEKVEKVDKKKTINLFEKKEENKMRQFNPRLPYPHEMHNNNRRFNINNIDFPSL